MPYQTADGARDAFMDMVQNIEGAGVSDHVENVEWDQTEPADMPAGGVFVTLLEGRDIPVETIIGGTRVVYEVYTEVTVVVFTSYADKSKGSIVRAAIIDAIEADPRLQDAVDDVLIVVASNDVDVVPGAERGRSSEIPVQLHYTSTSPVG